MSKKRRGHSDNASMNKKIKMQQGSAVTAIDSTSHLPDLVVHQVLKLLSTRHAIRATTLSKQWKREWPSVPVLDFDENEPYRFRCGKGLGLRAGLGLHARLHTDFENFVTRCLKHREKDKFALEKFRLRTYHVDPDLINEWLSFTFERNVKELYISLLSHNYYPFKENGDYLPLTVFNNAKVLTVLNLKRVEIKDDCNIDVISLPCLKSMSLKCVKLSDLGFFHFLSGCPCIENLSINSCVGLSEVIVSSSTLKSLEVIMSSPNYCINVEAMNLESLLLCGFHHGLSCNDIDFAYCGALRNLDLAYVEFEDEWFEGFDTRFPLLESLILENCCNVPEHMNLISPHLKRFVLKQGYSSAILGATVN